MKIIIGMLSGVLTFAGSALGEGVTSIRFKLWPTAVVTGNEVMLAEICDYRGLSAEQESVVAYLVVARSPSAGSSADITMDQLRDALGTTDINFAQVVFEGASKCAVRRPAEPDARLPRQPATVKPAALISQRAPLELNDDHQVTLAADHFTLPGEGEPGNLHGVLRRWFLDRMPVPGGRLELQFGSAIVPYLDFSETICRFRIENESTEPMGLVNLKVTITEPGRNPQTVPVAVQANYWVPQVVARGGINAKATITGSDIVLEERLLEKSADGTVFDQEAVLGQQARKYIAPGTVITSNMVQPLPLVRRGQLVDLISTAGGIVLQTTARAAVDGALGSRISVRTADRRREEVIGVVVGPNRVEVVDEHNDVARVLASSANKQ